MYVIIKHVKNARTGKALPVVVLGSENEILEFSDLESAEKMRDLFISNSDSGHLYEVRKVGK